MQVAEVKIWLKQGEKADIPVICSVPYSLFNGAYHYGLLSFKSVKNLFFFSAIKTSCLSWDLKILSLNHDEALAH